MPQTNVLKSAVQVLLGGYRHKIESFGFAEFLKTGVDPFRFTVNVSIWGLENAIKKEIEHKVEMALENLVGGFHENYLGNVIHRKKKTKWQIVPQGEIPGVDIANYDSNVFYQIKSKHNSMNSSSSKRLAQELEKVADEQKGATVGCCWVIATTKRKAIGEDAIAKIGEVVKGKAVYDVITGGEGEMDSVLEVLPELICEQIQKGSFDKVLADTASKIKSELEVLAKAENKTVIQIITDHSVD